MERFLRCNLYALVFLSALPFGSVRPRAVLTIELWAAVLGAAALYLLHRDPAILSPRARRLLAPVVVILAIGLVQFTPAPHAFVHAVARPTAEFRAAVARAAPHAARPLAPPSLSPPDTMDALLRFMAYAFIGLAAAVSHREPRHLKHAAAAIVASGSFQAVYGALEFLSGHQHIFGYRKQYYLDSATGTFINRNHYAAYLAVTLPFAFALAMSQRRRRGTGRDELPLWLRVFSADGRTRALAILAASAILTAVLLSFSRGGTIAALAGLVLYLARSRNQGRAPRLAIGLSVFALVLLSWQWTRPPGERFWSGSQDFATLNSRLPVWKAALELVPDYLAFGTGYGTFEESFKRVYSRDIRTRWDHAHNDWLQLVLEGGAAPLVLAFGALVVLRRIQARGRRPPEQAHAAPEHAGAFGALAIHAFADFPLRIPAVALLAAFGLFARVSSNPAPGARPPRDEGSAAVARRCGTPGIARTRERPDGARQRIEPRHPSCVIA